MTRVDLVDGTYELFRHFYAPGIPAPKPGDRAAVRGVLGTVLRMIEEGATHVAVATDHIVESFRNRLWAGYKTGEGLDPRLWDQFHPLEDSLESMGVRVWRMEDFEADDGLAAGASLATVESSVEQVRIWTPDKDLAQCIDGDRVVQVDRRSGRVRNEAAVIEKFGVPPAAIPDWLALVGDTSDGYPGLPGWGPKSAAAALTHYGRIEAIPDHGWSLPIRGAAVLAATLAQRREEALLFRTLATLRTDAPISTTLEELRWAGPDTSFAALAEALGARGLVERAERVAAVR